MVKKSIFLLITTFLFANWREGNVSEIDKVIKVYSLRVECLKEKEAIRCIEKFPLDPKSDTLAKTFNMSFPKSYYKAILKRNIQRLQEQKLCFGKALNVKEAKSCLNPAF
ncbi:MAG: hypothetical protein GXO61_02965 [Epsilonproteobacteria bacterium]|nr:hypothetical protein [Campylobacterota bacterium]